MKLSEIHAAIEAGLGPEFSKDQAFATLVAIEHLARIEGLPVSGLDFTPPLFGVKYTFRFADMDHFSGGKPRYLAWRNLILSAQMQFAPGDVDADPWASLGRAERISTGRVTSNLGGLYQNLPDGTLPQDVTDTLLAKVHEELQPSAEKQFRAGLNNFRLLFREALILRTGLLPDTRPQPLPGIRDHWLLTNMSPEIEGWRQGLTDREVIYSLDYLNRLAVMGNRLNGKTDTLDDLRTALCDLPHPSEVGIPSIKEATLRKYVNSVRCALGGRDPRKSPFEQAWADLRTEARAAGLETSFLWVIAQAAAGRGLIPREISEKIASDLMQTYEHSAMRSHFRSACEQLDALRGKVPADLLPPSPLGITRRPPLPPKEVKVKPRRSLAETSWAELYRRLRMRGWQNNQLNELSYLRVRACTAGKTPTSLNQEFIQDLERDAPNVPDRTRLRAAVRSIATLTKDPEFSDLPNITIPEDHRFTHGGPGLQAGTELEELMEFMSAANPTRRSFRVAVGVITDAMGRPDMGLRDILRADVSALDFGPHEPRRKVHTDKIRNLREFNELQWTPAWRELQALVVKTGVTALKNPVPKVLSWNPGTDPVGLKKEWAQRLDRELRSTLKNPPHGRADLAKTLAGHLAAFDALHDIPAVAESGLLPARIGPIR